MFHVVVEWPIYISIPLQVAHRTLDDEEAEERFAQRDKIMSRWTQNLSKKLNPDQGADDDELDDEDNKKGKKKGKFSWFLYIHFRFRCKAEFQLCVLTYSQIFFVKSQRSFNGFSSFNEFLWL